MYKVVIENYQVKNMGKIVSSHKTIANARKSAYETCDRIGRKVSIYKDNPTSRFGPFIPVAEIERDVINTYYFALKDSDTGAYIVGTYILNKDGSIKKV